MFNFGRENTGLVAKWWRNIDKQILLLFIFLLLLGLFFSFSSTTSVMSEKLNKQTYFFFIKHLIFVSFSCNEIKKIKNDEITTKIRCLMKKKYVCLFIFSPTIEEVEEKEKKSPSKKRNTNKNKISLSTFLHHFATRLVLSL